MTQPAIIHQVGEVKNQNRVEKQINEKEQKLTENLRDRGDQKFKEELR
jgi:hypothetical protein